MRKSVSYLNNLRLDFEEAKARVAQSLDDLECAQFEVMQGLTTEHLRQCGVQDSNAVLCPLTNLLKVYKKDLESLRLAVKNYNMFF